ncbi:hypothetical protein MASR2M48_09130 [Spirochaetota bacterium]
MREVVERVLSAEDEAKSRIDSARQRAQAIRTEADEAASALIGKAREKAVADSRLMLDKARNASEESLLKATGRWRQRRSLVCRICTESIK